MGIIVSSDTIVLASYAIMLYMIISSIQHLRKFLKKKTVEGINSKAAFLHLFVILVFFVTQAMYNAIIYSTLIIAGRDQSHSEDIVREGIILGWFSKELGQFIGCMTLLYMFWHYTVI